MLPVIPASPADGVKRLECSSERLGAGSHAISKAALAAGENAARLVREQCPAEPTEDRLGVFDSRTLSTESRREHWKHRFRDGRSNVDVEIGKVECGAKHDADNAALIARLRVSKEGQEGLSAFLDKRKPNWIAQ